MAVYSFSANVSRYLVGGAENIISHYLSFVDAMLDAMIVAMVRPASRQSDSALG